MQLVAIVSTAADPSALEALTMAEASQITGSAEVTRRVFSSVALALGWAYANAQKMPAGLLAMDVPPAVFKRPAHAYAPQAESPDDVMNGGPDYLAA